MTAHPVIIPLPPESRASENGRGHEVAGEVGMLNRDDVIAQLVDTAVASAPTIATARRTLRDWAGHPADPEMKADALAELERRAAA